MHIKGNTGIWEYVIGLEVHAQVTSNAKLFSGASTLFGQEPNTQVSFIDAGMPGMLPVLNKFCVEQAVKTGLAINAKINKFSAFDRKNYFYPDLPTGYQISQFYHPIVSDGIIEIEVEGKIKQIRVERIHLEQDAGKSIHDNSDKYTLIDFNRAGVALMEIVTAPDLRSPEEASQCLKKLRSILRCIRTCDGNMEQGSLRCDANVSVRRTGEPLGTRCEIKNLNSIKNIVKAIEYEGLRQVEILESNGKIEQETRLFDAQTGKTRLMRSKEDALDYRYFPDPDLLPVILEDQDIEKIAQNLPELPDAKAGRYIEQFGLSKYDAFVLVSEQEIAQYFEQAACQADAKAVANWITGELFSYLNKSNLEISACPVSPQDLAKLINLVKDGSISIKIAKEVFEEMFNTSRTAQEIIQEKGLVQISDQALLEEAIDRVIANNLDSLEAYKAGKDKLFGFFVGQTMKETQGKGNPAMVNELLKKKLIS